MAHLRSAQARATALATAALSEVFDKLSIGRTGPPEVVTVWLALPDARPGFDRPEAAEVLARIQATPFVGVSRIKIEALPSGHAGALQGLDLAARQIASRRIEIAVVGGVDSYFDPATLRWLESNRRLARDGVRGGLVPGEASAMFVLTSRAEGQRRGLPSIARVRAVAVGREPRSLDSDEGTLGEGLTDVVTRVTAELRLPAESVDDIYCDIGPERHRTEEWGYTALRQSPAFKDATSYQTPVGSWGDVGAASGALAVVLAAQAWRRHYASGPRALVWASSPQGLRGAALLENGEV